MLLFMHSRCDTEQRRLHHSCYTRSSGNINIHWSAKLTWHRSTDRLYSRAHITRCPATSRPCFITDRLASQPASQSHSIGAALRLRGRPETTVIHADMFTGNSLKRVNRSCRYTMSSGRTSRAGAALRCDGTFAGASSFAVDQWCHRCIAPTHSHRLVMLSLAVAEADVTSSVPLACCLSAPFDAWWLRRRLPPRDRPTPRLTRRSAFIRPLRRSLSRRSNDSAALASGRAISVVRPTTSTAQFHVIAVVTIDEFVYNVGSQGSPRPARPPPLMLEISLLRSDRDFVRTDSISAALTLMITLMYITPLVLCFLQRENRTINVRYRHIVHSVISVLDDSWPAANGRLKSRFSQLSVSVSFTLV